jgi:hypothetical protein
MVIITYAPSRSHVVNSTLKLLLRCCLCISILRQFLILCTHGVFNDKHIRVMILMRIRNIF